MNNPLDSPFIHRCSCLEEALCRLNVADDVKVQFGKDVCTVLFFNNTTPIMDIFMYQIHATKLHLLFGAKFNQLIP